MSYNVIELSHLFFMLFQWDKKCKQVSKKEISTLQEQNLGGVLWNVLLEFTFDLP